MGNSYAYVHTGSPLPAGTWVITGKVTLDQQASDGIVVTCRLDVTGQTHLDESSFVDWDSWSDHTQIVLLGTATSNGTAKPGIACTDSDIGDVYWKHARLLAMKIA